ncbi:hypothetical protein [Ectopseudomonas guguanensis]|nr:hypothetical protein [Pseudomonas guguanensis]
MQPATIAVAAAGASHRLRLLSEKVRGYKVSAFGRQNFAAVRLAP